MDAFGNAVGNAIVANRIDAGKPKPNGSNTNSSTQSPNSTNSTPATTSASSATQSQGATDLAKENALQRWNRLEASGGLDNLSDAEYYNLATSANSIEDAMSQVTSFDRLVNSSLRQRNSLNADLADKARKVASLGGDSSWHYRNTLNTQPRFDLGGVNPMLSGGYDLEASLGNGLAWPDMSYAATPGPWREGYIMPEDMAEIPLWVSQLLGAADRLAEISQRVGNTKITTAEFTHVFDEGVYSRSYSGDAKVQYKTGNLLNGDIALLSKTVSINAPTLNSVELPHSSIYADGAELFRHNHELVTSTEHSRLLDNNSKLYTSAKYLGHFGDALEIGVDTYNNFNQAGVSPRAIIASSLDTGQVFLSGWASTVVGTVVGTGAATATAATVVGAPAAPAAGLATGVATGVAVDYGIDYVYDNYLREPAIDTITAAYDGARSVYRFITD